MSVVAKAEGEFTLAPADQARFERHVREAVRRARRGSEPVLAAVTVAVRADADPAGVAFASRVGGEPMAVFETPERGGAALGALGCVQALEASGPGRFGEVARAWRALAARAVSDGADGPTGSGPVALGGFAFAPQGGRSSQWSGFAPASLHVPEVVLARRDGAVRLTACVLARAEDDPDALVAGVQERLSTLRDVPLPLLDPAPAGRVDVASVMPPSHYVEAVARAVERIRAGALEKIVLAREVGVSTTATHDVAAVHGVLREAFPSCFVFAVARGDRTFVAATPELLVRREGMRASTLGLAGSMRRSADPAVDDHLGEQLLRSDKDRAEHEIVVRRIERSLRPLSLWVTAAPEPQVVKIANIQHLATPIRAQLGEAVGAVDLVGTLHPTPAVGGEPFSIASGLIPALEGLDRGWYAGPVGWTDASEDGEFCVALRCALVRGGEARCYAGVGVVADSDPAAELAETEIKLQALLPVLAI